MRQRARWAVRLVTPWGIEWLLHRRQQRQALRRIRTARAQAGPTATRVEDAIRFLVERGLDEYEVREGSMPEASLDYTAELVSDRLPRDGPVRALHVGNFVGVSLCYFSWLVRERHPDSIVVSIDPNIAHRGIEDPQAHVVALLHHFGLLGNNLIIPGYTLDQTAEGLGSENVLAALERVAGGRFDLVLLDGDHEESYLAREFTVLRGLLANDGVVVFDDITEWDGVVEVFRRAFESDDFVELGQDGRVGILQVRSS